jgi:DNA-binding IclR family transcriptional regulator
MARTLLRGLALMESLAASGVPMGLTELARSINLDKGTAARLLGTLVAAGYARKDASGKYVLTSKLMQLGQGAFSDFDLRQRSRPYLTRLRDEVNETVHLGVIENDEVLYLDQLQPTHALILVVMTGQRCPLYSTALGKAMLAGLGESEREQILRRLTFSSRTVATITSRAALRAELRLTAERGYAIDAEENVVGGTCVGAAILGRHGAVLGAVSIAYPSSRNSDRMDQLGAKALATANAISGEAGANLGAPVSASGKSSHWRSALPVDA